MKAVIGKRRYYGNFGGSFVAETLMPLLIELEAAFQKFLKDSKLKKQLKGLFKEYAGRPTPLYYARNLSRELGMDVYLKREDLLHTGSHKINNALGQALLAKTMNKRRVIAETGAGQHGVATATASACFGFECIIFMGEIDVKRQAANVRKMELLGAKVVPVKSGSRTLKDAINEALRFWTANAKDTHYLIGSVVGPHPYPRIVRYFQSVIGYELKEQFFKKNRRYPECIVACVGGGSNSAGIFSPFIGRSEVKLFGVEAGGSLKRPCKHAASLTKGSPGIFQGCRTYLLQDASGNVQEAHSIAAGLDYPATGPEHAYWKEKGLVKYDIVHDEEAIEAFRMLSELEGIIPAFETAHAVAYLKKLKEMGFKEAVVCLSGRGDKDLDTYFALTK